MICKSRFEDAALKLDLRWLALRQLSLSWASSENEGQMVL
jgi:hypothetical protein